MNFADRLNKAIKDKKSVVCVGLDPRLNKIPSFIQEKALKKNKKKLKAAAKAILEFNKGIINAVYDLVPVVKPQVAFYEIFGEEGMWAYRETIEYAHKKGLIVIADIKRNDIGSTAEAYADSYLGTVNVFGEEQSVFDADAVTINPYLGWDGIKPFAEKCAEYNKGMFILVKTSNHSSGDLQDLQMADGRTIYEIMGMLVESWGASDIGESGYNPIGAVVGATYPHQAKKLRELMPNSIFLVPGYGAQGGGAQDVKPCFNKDGLGAIVNSSRGIIFAYEKSDKYTEDDYDKAAREAVVAMNKDLEGVR
ncbi:orotidine-5'-phosphate decarboxylase [bacterium]|nr:orotidine-5'-phosphate decarboxylase [bacterium]